MMIKPSSVGKLSALALATTLTACGSTSSSSDGSSGLVQTKPAKQITGEPVTPSDKWKLIWSDEFEGDEIDTRKWGFEENCWGGGNNEQQCYTNRKVNAFVEDGKLNIVAKKGNFTGPDNPDGKKGLNKTLPFTSARLRTLNKKEWKYGRFEIRAKLPSGQGTWPAIWMLPSDWVYGGWAASGEIDIMEAVNLKAKSDETGAIGEPESRIHGTLHFGKKWPDNAHVGQGVKLPNGANPADDYHTYAIEWEEGEIRWYVDNYHYATQTHEGWYSQYEKDGMLVNAESEAPFNQKFHLLLNLAVGGNWAAKANEGGIDESIFPQTFSIDSVKVYRCTVDRWKGKGCAAKSDNAVLVAGVKPPAILAVDDAYADGPLLDIYSDSLNKSLAFESYNPVDTVKYSEVDEASRGKVIKVSKSNGAGNIYFRAPLTDLSHWLESGQLIFDIKVEEQASNAKLLVKLDSGWPHTSDVEVPLPASGEWKEVRLNIKDILAGGNSHAAGKKADIAAISNLLVFEPSDKMTFKLDNIRFEKK
ncbi:glycoside hydrolase family 16 protein [Agarivorans sp. B2Z047]|uniref:glycoside hydrolase family 16 protein n=1 Tax=Agarivorans sp. B2Z047 TaxID=2652721 RepID=UPI001D15C5BB|nr:glycoside hydrolase family 16 protein [Agarivorans sp. B2Z047]UQN42219.1 glycoside hydrolase family 16 protein [Agarivorans sp. B2Z047]